MDRTGGCLVGGEGPFLTRGTRGFSPGPSSVATNSQLGCSARFRQTVLAALLNAAPPKRNGTR